MKVDDLALFARMVARREASRLESINANNYGHGLTLQLLNEGRVMADQINSLFDTSDACGMPLPEACPGIGKVRIPEDVDGLWDPKDVFTFATALIKAAQEASS